MAEQVISDQEGVPLLQKLPAAGDSDNNLQSEMEANQFVKISAVETDQSEPVEQIQSQVLELQGEEMAGIEVIEVAPNQSIDSVGTATQHTYLIQQAHQLSLSFWRTKLSTSLSDLIYHLNLVSKYKVQSHQPFHQLESLIHQPTALQIVDAEPGAGDGVQKMVQIAMPSLQFGKLGKVINTQVFEFDQWDQFESNMPLKVSDLMLKLISLRNSVANAKELYDLDGLTLLDPILTILTAPELNGQISSSCLTLLAEWIQANLINSLTPNLPATLRSLFKALIKCHRSSLETGPDEVMVLKLMQIYTCILQSDQLIYFCSDKEVMSLVKNAINLACLLRLSPGLRSQLETGLKSMLLHATQLDFHTDLSMYAICKDLISLLEPHNVQHSNYMRLLGLTLITHLLVNSPTRLLNSDKINRLFRNQLSFYTWMLIEGDHVLIVTKALELMALMMELDRVHLKQQHLLWIQAILTRLNKLHQNPLALTTKQDELHFVLTNFLSNHFTTYPNLLSELLINFDAALNQPNLGLELVQFLIEGSAQGSLNRINQNVWLHHVNTLMDHMMAPIGFMPHHSTLTDLTGLDLTSKPINATPHSNFGDAFYTKMTNKDVMDVQANKKMIAQAVTHFNEKPMKGLEFLIDNQMLPVKDDPEFNIKVAKFLVHTVGLDKRKLGEFIGKRDNGQLLNAFVNEFEFGQRRIDEAMRLFLESFRLPGESQMIERIFECFSECYFNTQPAHIATVDAVFVMAYSIIMVNTDLHSPQVRVRMTFQEYCRNLRGVNQNQDFDEAFLRDVFDAVRTNEIVMPEERDGRIGLEYHWKFYTLNDAFQGDYMLSRDHQFDKEVFLMIANQLVDLFIQIFKGASNDITIQAGLQGLYKSWILAHYFGASDVADYLIRKLMSLTGTLFGEGGDGIYGDDALTQPRSPAPHRAQQVDGTVLSDASLTLGQSYKSQLITLFVLNGVGQMPTSLFNGWWDVLDVLRVMVDGFLVPKSMLDVPTYKLDPNQQLTLVALPFRPPTSSALSKRSKSRRQPSGTIPESPSHADDHADTGRQQDIVTSESTVGLFSTLSSYLGYHTQYPDLVWDVSPHLLFSYLEAAQKVVNPCHLDEIGDAVTRLDFDSFVAVLKRVMISLKQRHFVTDEVSPPIPVPPQPSALTATATSISIGSRPDTPSSVNSGRKVPAKRVGGYHPSTAFFFHWLVQLVSKRPDQEDHWPLIISFLGDIFYHADFYHPYLIKRAISELICILTLGKLTMDGMLLDHRLRILDILASLSPAAVELGCHPLVVGFSKIQQDVPSIFGQTSYWTTCLQILQVLINHDDKVVVNHVFNLLQNLVQSIASIQLDHPDYLALVNLLVEFSNPDRFIVSSGDLVEPLLIRSSQAIQSLSQLVQLAPTLTLTSQVAEMDRSALILPPLMGLSSLSHHWRKEMCNAAFSHLKRGIMAKDLIGAHSSPNQWAPIMQRVVYPLVEKVIDARPNPTTPTQPDHGLRTVSLMSNLFLHFVSLTMIPFPKDQSHYTQFQPLWLATLDLFLRLAQNADTDPILKESTVENLKNVLLVLTSTQLLYPPVNEGGDNEQVKRNSQHTWALIDSTLPTLTTQLFPDSQLPNQQATVESGDIGVKVQGANTGDLSTTSQILITPTEEPEQSYTISDQQQKQEAENVAENSPEEAEQFVIQPVIESRAEKKPGSLLVNPFSSVIVSNLDAANKAMDPPPSPTAMAYGYL